MSDEQKLSRFEINKGIARLMGWQITTVHDSVFLEQPVKAYGLDYHQVFDVLDGSIGSKALCLDLLEKFVVTYHPKRMDVPYRYSQKYGPYARCGSHEPVYDESPEKAICTAVLLTYSQ